MSHYFKTDETLEHGYQIFNVDVRGVSLSLTTDRGVFSKNYVDFGTRVLLEHLDLNDVKKALDLGCGYGPIGLFMARYDDQIDVTMSDVNERAISLVKKNISNNNIKNAKVVLSGAFEAIDDTFDLIVTNPPIRAGKETVFAIYEGAYEHLEKGGIFYVVIQKKQGAPSTLEKITTLFGNGKIVTKTKGYWVLLAKK